MIKNNYIKLLICLGISIHYFNVNSAEAEVDNIQFNTSGLIDSNNSGWLYAGKLLFDEQENLFKYWGCAGVGPSSPGDNIVYKQSATYDGLANAPLQIALAPSHNNNKFDRDHTCDPSVIEHEGLFYLHYTGLNDLESGGGIGPSRAGVAISYNRGRTFERLFNGEPIIKPLPENEDPNVYGTGQSSVAKADDGYFYMVYSDHIFNTQGNFLSQYARIIRSPLPSFPISLQEEVAFYPDNQVGGASLDLIFNRGRGRLETVGNNFDPAMNNNNVIITHFDDNLSITGQTNYDYSATNFTFGEGIATLTNTLAEPIPYMFNNRMHWNFVATTFGNRPPLSNHITGPLMHTRFTEGVNGTLTDFSKVGDKKLSGDLDGDGINDIIVVDSGLVWKWKLSSQQFSQVHSTQWGWPGNDTPIIVRDWNNDGLDEIAVYRPAAGKWFILHSNGGHDIITWGLNGDIPLSGDMNGDGRGELVLWRPATGDWFILFDGSWPNATFNVFNWGINGDNPFIFDQNNDNKDDFLIWRPGNSTEYPHLSIF